MPKNLPLPCEYSPFARLLGLRIASMQPGRAEGQLEVADNLTNNLGVTHGAVIFALADSAMGGAVYGLMEANESCQAAEVSIRYLKPAAPGGLVCHASVGARRGNLVTAEGEIWQQQTLIAKAQGKYYVMTRGSDLAESS